VDHHAPLYRRDFEEGTEAILVAESVDFWLENGMPAEKLIFGLPSYGRSWTLQDPTQTGLLSPATEAGPAGKYTGAEGFLSLYEMCLYQQSGWTTVIDDSGKMGPYSFGSNSKGTTWASWDDVDMAILKVKYAMSKNLGGIMFWELSLDDFLGFCNMGPRYEIKLNCVIDSRIITFLLNSPFSNAITATLEGRPFNTSTPAPTPTLYPITTQRPSYSTFDTVVIANIFLLNKFDIL
jgi:chitinase